MRKKGGTPKRRLAKEVYVFIALIVVSFSLLVFSTRSLMENFSDAGLSFFSGIRGTVNDVSQFISTTILSIRELSKLREEHSELLLRFNRYEQLERNASEILQENRRLREQLGFQQNSGYRHIPAEVIGRDPDNLFSALVINKGQSSGVYRDMPVIAFQGGVQALVGKVIISRAYESMVMPLYDSSLQISSRFSVSRYEGIVEGQGNTDTPMRMRFIPKRARDEIAAGDLIVSSGMGGIYPPGINIGRVSGISLREYDTSMEVELRPIVDFSRLEYVFIIDKETLQTEDAVAGSTAGDISQSDLSQNDLSFNDISLIDAWERDSDAREAAAREAAARETAAREAAAREAARREAAAREAARREAAAREAAAREAAEREAAAIEAADEEDASDLEASTVDSSAEEENPVEEIEQALTEGQND